jgi:hypothetical protein
VKISLSRKNYLGMAALLVLSASCKQTKVDDGSAELDASGLNAPGTGEDGRQRNEAYKFVKDSLAKVRKVDTHIKYGETKVYSTTTPDNIIRLLNMPLRNPMKSDEDKKRGATPKNLQGIFWMRGNPLPDYLISFSNMIWGEENFNDGSRVGYLPTYMPGSFIWKPKALTTAAQDENDYKSLPEVCKTPEDFNLKAAIQYKVNVKAPIAFDQRVEAANKNLERNPEYEEEISKYRNLKQMDLDGTTALDLLSKGKVFYEAKFTNDYKNVEVLVFATPFSFTKLVAPNVLAAFSYAPYKNEDGTDDPNVFMRKTHISGLSPKGTPLYYAFTRIIDADGKAIQPYYNEFLDCVQQRSQGRVLVPVEKSR